MNRRHPAPPTRQFHLVSRRRKFPGCASIPASACARAHRPAAQTRFYFGFPPRFVPPLDFMLWFPRTLAGRPPEENAPGFGDGAEGAGFACGYPRSGCTLGRVTGAVGTGRVDGAPGRGAGLPGFGPVTG
jgi:hypothetical protein